MNFDQWLANQNQAIAQIDGSQAPAPGMGWAEGFGKSALWGLGPDMLGVKPSGELQAWREENPWSSIGSQMVGMAIPYAGWAAASARIPAMTKAIGAVAGPTAMANTPFRAGAAREIVRFAPFEASRIAANFAFGDQVAEATGGIDQGVGATAVESGLNTALGGVVGGAIPKLASVARDKIQVRGITPGANVTDATQLQMRSVLEKLRLGEVQPEYEGMARAGVNRLRNKILGEAPIKSRYIQEPGREELNTLFTPGRDKFVRGQRVTDLQDRNTLEALQNALPENWEAYAQFPRILSPKTGLSSSEQGAQQRLGEIVGTLSHGADDLRWDFLPEEGKFVVAKRFHANNWLTFKTDRPEVFMPREAYIASGMQRFEASAFAPYRQVDPSGNTGSSVLDYGIDVERSTPVVDTRGLGKSSALGKSASAAAAKVENKSFSLGDARYEIGAAVKGLGEVKAQAGRFIKDVLAPSSFQFAENPIALRIHRTTQRMVEHGEYLAQRAILGNPLRAQSSKMQYRDNALGARFEGNNSIADRIRKLAKTDENGYRALVRSIQSEQGIDWGIRNGLTKDGVEIMQELQQADSELAKSIIAAQRAAGIDESRIFSPRENHFMLSRTWQGNYRTPVYNGNKLVYVAGGNTPKQSQELAKRVAETEGWRMGETISSSARKDFDMLKTLADRDFDYIRAMQRHNEVVEPKVFDPKTMEARKGIEGYQTEFTPDELIKALVGHTTRYRRYEAEMGFEGLFKKDFDTLVNSSIPEDKIMAARLASRLDALFGIRSENFDLAVNRALDNSPLGDLLGGDSASKTVQALSKYTYLAALGFWNMGYAVATLGTFMQTAFPQMSYINTLASTAPERLHKYVSYQPLMSADGQAGTIMGKLDNFKIASQAMKEMGKPDDTLSEHLYRAAAEGKTDPRFLDEYVGQNANGVQRFKEIFQGKSPIADAITAVGSFVPGTTERMARVHSFTMGHIFYRDIMNVKDPETLYRLASEFVDITQFQYGRAYKPRVFDGPGGQMLGLFKTFISNYIGWMSVYAGEAVKYGNFAPLAWQMAGTAALGGVGALPLIGAANGIVKSFDENDRGVAELLRASMGGADAPVGNYFSNILYFGLPSIIGTTIQGTVQAPFANPVEDSIRLLTSAQLDQAMRMGKAIGAGVDALLNPNLAMDPATHRTLANGFLPRSMVRSAQALADSDLRSMNTGNILMKDLTPVERMLWGLGLNPSETAMTFTVFRDRMNTEQGKKDMLGSLARRATDAVLGRNPYELGPIINEASLSGVDVGSLANSIRTRVSQDHKDMFDQHLDRIGWVRMRELGLAR